jgi:hypothetical protein
MWVCPIDWNEEADRHFHVFFKNEGDGFLWLYRFYTGGTLMYCRHESEDATSNISGGGALPLWAPGAWHHLAGVWSRAGIYLYVDGKLAGCSAGDATIRKLGAEFCIGDRDDEFRNRTSSSLIERVRIYDKALTAELIEAHFRGDYSKIASVTTDSVELSFSGDLEQKLLTAHAACLYPADTEMRVSFALKKGDAPADVTKPISFVKRVATTEFSLAGGNPGDTYELSAALSRENGDVLARVTKSVHIPDVKQWEGNQIGLGDQIPIPWTPLAVSEQEGRSVQVSCWGRDYTFGTSALPDQIESGQKSLLSRPVSVNAWVGGEQIQWGSGSPKVASSSAAAADIQSRSTGTCRAGKASLNVGVHVEYDGLILMDVGLSLPGNVSDRQVSIDIPLRPEAALYYHRWSPNWAGCSGALALTQGNLESLPYIPYAWLGDNDRGLFWFCESGENWPNWEKKDAFQIVREGGEVVMRLNLLEAGQTAKGPWHFRFGLQATPVKETRRGSREWTTHIAVPWPDPVENSETHYGYPEARNPKIYANRVRGLQAMGQKVLPYSMLSYFSIGAPEARWFQKDWLDLVAGPTFQECSDVARYGKGEELFAAFPQARFYADFIVWKNIEFLKKYHLDGLYHDNVMVNACSRASVGDGWTDSNGRRQPCYPVLATRSLYRRIYAAVHAAKPDAILMGHMSGKMWIPVLAYEDCYLDGEFFIGQVKESYLDVMPLEMFRAEFMGRQWGLKPFFIPEFDEKAIAEVAPTREFMAILILHDTGVWPLDRCNAKEAQEMYDKLAAFGYGDADFIPYFDAEPPAATDMKGVYVSVYKRPDGRALAFVANLSKEDCTGSISFDEKRIGFPIKSISSWRDAAPVQVEGHTVKLAVAKSDYRMLLLEAGK